MSTIHPGIAFGRQVLSHLAASEAANGIKSAVTGIFGNNQQKNPEQNSEDNHSFSKHNVRQVGLA